MLRKSNQTAIDNKPCDLNAVAGFLMAGAAGIEPATYGFGESIRPFALAGVR